MTSIEKTVRAVVLPLALALAFASPASPADTARRPIAETDLFRFVWIADPQIAPDGRQVIFVRVTVDEKKEGYETALWSVGTDGKEPARPFTAGPRDAAPRWSPDGKRLAFVRAVKKDDKFQDPQIYVISTAGGEAVAVTDLPKGAGNPVWSPDGKSIAFLATANEKDMEEVRKKKEDGKDKDKAEKDQDKERESDVRVITRAEYRSDGGGYDDPTRPAHVWTVEVPAVIAKVPEPRQITSGPYEEGNPSWSPDGTQLYFLSDRVDEPYYLPNDTNLYAVPAAGGEIRVVADIDGGIGGYTLSRDGKRVAFGGAANGKPERSYNEPDLFVADLGGAARNLTAAWDGHLGGAITGDQHPPRGGRPIPVVWSQDGKGLLALSANRGRANLFRFEAGVGTPTPVTQGDQEIVSYTATPDASRFALVLSSPTVITDLYAFETATGKLTPLVKPNEELFAELDLSAPEEITYKSFDGREIHAWVQKPPGFDAGKKYPLILNIHGGPHAAYGYCFFHEFLWMAAKGYVVLYPNPRGSSSYGQEFGNVIQYEFPGDDAKDLLAGVDELVRRGYVDEKKLGVTGGSGGGILTNWIVTQDQRFAAAVAQRSIASWDDFFYTADFTLFTPRWFKGSPWEDPADFARRSPITHVDKVTTPLMLIEGEADYRTPPGAGGEQMFRALKYRKVPTVMIRFPGEPHGLSRTGQPWHRIERLRHLVAWFDKWLKGEKVEGY